MKNHSSLLKALIPIFSLLFFTSSVFGQGDRSDYKVFDQSGQERSFFQDVIGTKKAIVAFSYSRCSGVCPMTLQKFKNLQKALGNRLGDDVTLVTLSIDPEQDDLPSLKKWAKTAEAAPGWQFVSGKRSDLNAISQKIFGGPLISKDMHSPFIVVKGADGRWTRMYGLTPAKEILEAIDSKILGSSR